MSWFTDIAGKAEDLLNRVDQTAATALQIKQKSAGYHNNLRGNVLDSVSVQSSTVTFNALSSAQSPKTSVQTTPFKTQLVDSRVQYNQPLVLKKKPKSDDEKLLEYLNSTDDFPTSSRKLVSDTDVKKHVEIEKSNFNEKSKSMDENKSENQLQADNQNAKGVHTETLSIIEMDVTEQPTTVDNSLTSYDEPFTSAKQTEKNSSSKDVVEKTSLNPSQSQQNTALSGLEEEKKMLLDENVTLKQELFESFKRVEHAEAEMKRMKRKLDHWNSQISGSDNLIRELQERETDLTAALGAKDSQLAVLKVRLQEADQELLSKRSLVEELRYENERIIKDHNDSTSLQSQTVEGLREKLQQTETELAREKEAYCAAQTEHIQRMSRMEEEQQHLVENVTDLQKQLSELRAKNKDSVAQLKVANGNLESLHQEYADYKQKAQRILQSKEKLISSLKDNHSNLEQQESSEGTYALLCAEAEEVKQERDLLREELQRANAALEAYRAEVQELEQMAQNDSDAAQEHLRTFEEQLYQEKQLREETDLLNSQLKDEMKFLREDLTRTKTNFQSRIQDRDSEIEKLRKQLTAKSLSTVSQDELESRLHALTENLIQKQTVVEALNTEKNSLVLQLERLEQQLREAQIYGSQHHTIVGVINETENKSKLSMFSENPFDSTVTRKVKRMYGSIDAFSIRLGVFLRRYPVARVFIIVYMLFLHLWVMIVLLTYQPEVHKSYYNNVKDSSTV